MSTQAENHEIVINGARCRVEFDRQVKLATNQGISEVYGVSGGLEEIHFADKSILVIDNEAQTAAAYA